MCCVVEESIDDFKQAIHTLKKKRKQPSIPLSYVGFKRRDVVSAARIYFFIREVEYNTEPPETTRTNVVR